ncbi:MAG TPA: hypothetical protein VFR49_02375, partial [Solirubrobacteraceae bacterium]|nr:hypothetical protein [Solirubrobacteraceae bacterium]
MAGPSWLVLCSAADAPALWVYERLRARNRAPVALLLVEALAHGATRWEQRIAAGRATTNLSTGDGRQFRGDALGAVLNRMTAPPLVVLDAADPGDREYARSELSAFAASWLRTLAANVLNAPDPHGLCGRWRSELEWRGLGARAVLTCAPLRLASDGPDRPQPWAAPVAGAGTTTVLSVDGRLLHPGGVPSALHQAGA